MKLGQFRNSLNVGVVRRRRSNSDNSEIKSISILSLENKQILFTENNDTNLDLSSLNSGVYFVEIMTNNGLKVSRKIVKI